MEKWNQSTTMRALLNKEISRTLCQDLHPIDRVAVHGVSSPSRSREGRLAEFRSAPIGWQEENGNLPEMEIEDRFDWPDNV
jgi:hypothetical protein